MNDETYMDPETGLRYCSTCHTPREKRLPAPVAGMDRVPMLCQCQRDAQERKEALEKEQEHNAHIHHLREDAFEEFPGRAWRFSTVEMTPALEKVQSYCAHWEELSPDGIGLLLFGDVGTGKTYAAGCIANALIDQGHSVRFVSLSDVVNRMQGFRGSERDDYLRKLMRPELLILDDLGSERTTSYGQEQVFTVLNKRRYTGKPMIVTTNLTPSLMNSTTDLQAKRIYDRVLEVCVPVIFRGENFRQKAAARNLAKARAILGIGREQGRAGA